MKSKLSKLPLLVCGGILATAVVASIGISVINFNVNNPGDTGLPVQAVAQRQNPVESLPLGPVVDLLADYATDDALTLSFSVTDSFQPGGTSVEITASNLSARIYYTLDGSWPTTASSPYTGPVNLLSTRNVMAIPLRAIAVYGNTVSATKTQTYFTGATLDSRFDTLVFSITADPDGLFGHYNGILVPGALREAFIAENPGHYVIPPDPANFNLRGMEAERAMYMEVFEPDGALIFSQAGGVRTHGGWSRARNHPSLRLIARRIYTPDDGQFHFDFFPWEYAADGSPITRYDTLILRNGGNDHDHGKLRHEVGSTLARNAGFVAVSPVRPAAVFVNGSYYGFKWLQVRFNPQYIENLFSTPTRNIDVVGMGEWWFDTDDQRIIDDLHYKNSFGYKDFNDPAVFARFEEIVDIENKLLYYALQIYMGNEDWPQNNLRRWRYTGPELGLTPESDGRWRYILFDLDWTFGLYGDRYTKPTFNNVLVDYNGNGPRSRLLANLLTRPDMQQRFTEILEFLAFEIITEENVASTIEYLYTAARNEITHTQNAGITPYWTTTDFIEYNHRNMIAFASRRHIQIFRDLENFIANMS